MKSRFAFALLAVALLAGCTITRYSHPQGGAFTRISLGTSQNIGPIDVTTTDGTKVRVDGYASDQAQVAGAVVTAALKAGAK